MLAGGHRGQWKMVELVTRNFWWPRVTTGVKQYVEGCDLCQGTRTRQNHQQEILWKLSEVPTPSRN